MTNTNFPKFEFTNSYFQINSRSMTIQQEVENDYRNDVLRSIMDNKDTYERDF
jgi:hypothetical protein